MTRRGPRVDEPSYGYDNYVEGLVNAGFTGLVWAPETFCAGLTICLGRKKELCRFEQAETKQNRKVHRSL